MKTLIDALKSVSPQTQPLLAEVRRIQQAAIAEAFAEFFAAFPDLQTLQLSGERDWSEVYFYAETSADSRFLINGIDPFTVTKLRFEKGDGFYYAATSAEYEYLVPIFEAAVKLLNYVNEKTVQDIYGLYTEVRVSRAAEGGVTIEMLYS